MYGQVVVFSGSTPVESLRASNCAFKLPSFLILIIFGGLVRFF